MKKTAINNSSTKSNTSKKLGSKIYGLVWFMLGLMMIATGAGIWQMNKIGMEIEGIAERDLPLTEALTKITIHKLEQAVYLERAFRAGIEMAENAEIEPVYEKAKSHFKGLTDKIEKEFKVAEKISSNAHDMATTEAEKHEFTTVLSALKKIEEEYLEYDYQAMRAFKLFRARSISKVKKLLPKIEAEQGRLDTELEKILFEVEKFTVQAAKSAEEHEHFALKLMMAITAFSLMIAGIVSYFLVRDSISRPLHDVLTGLDALNQGDFSNDVKVHHNDEIGAVAKAYAQFKATAMEQQRLEQEKKRDRGEQARRRTAIDNVTNDFSTNISGIVEAVSSASDELQVTAQSMSGISEQTSNQAAEASAGSQQTLGNVQSVATATEEMTSTIGEISQQVAQASNASREAVSEVSNTSEQMGALAETANKIGEVVEIISGIAEQTNLLALNATIESARAGEAGKGFAVVAGEVKQLASQTAKATGEISQQISDIQNATKLASGSMDSVAQAIGKVDEISTAIAAAMEEQSAATQEIASSVHQAAVGTQQVNDNIGSVSQASQEAGTASGQVMSAAGELSQQAVLLKKEVNNFIEKMRAG